MKALLIALFAGMVSCAFAQPVWAANADTYKEKVLWSFGGDDGADPSANVIEVKGTLYGTTSGGGGGVGCGTVFSFDPNTGTEAMLYAFDTDAASPEAGLIDVKGTLYGTTGGGGCEGQYGTVFAFDLNTGTETVLHRFADGVYSLAGLIKVKGTLYGTTTGEGAGAVFSVDPTTGVENIIYSFCSQPNCTDGKDPSASLIDVNGKLYGTTKHGGNNDAGTVFAISRKTGKEKVLYSFCSQSNCTDGKSPSANLIDVNGILYGTTKDGGASGQCSYGCGTVFSIDPSTSTETVLHSFAITDGALPVAGLIDVEGVLYGTTQFGGSAAGGGAIFSIDPGTGTETVLYAFCSQAHCADGEYPLASLINVNGKFYGTTLWGGAYGYGTVFVLKEKR